MKNKEVMIKLFKEHGGKIAIDDFGAGYNNEGALISISPDFLKIDMSLVRDIDKDQHKQQLVSNLIKYTKSNGVKTIAEGVESLAEMRTLISLKVDCLQGFYLGRPHDKPADIPGRVKEEINYFNHMN
jgi:EAL domain-containing protein (putative c-di-GMP-specific phosphodiesterase class I)